MARRRNVPIIPRPLHTDATVVARRIETGDNWFTAWQQQMATPWSKLARLTGISQARFAAISHGDSVSRPELEALAKAWGASTEALIASMPDASIVVG